MQLKTLLNRVHRIKGFVYENDKIIKNPNAVNGIGIEVTIRPRAGSRGYCSGCGKRGRTYDTQPPRRFGFVPLWGIAMALVYAHDKHKMKMIDAKCSKTGKLNGCFHNRQ